MNEALVVILAFLWALLLLPGAIRSRRRDPTSTVGGFTRAMEVLRENPELRGSLHSEEGVRIIGGEHQYLSPVPPLLSDEDDAPHGFDPILVRRRRVFISLLVITLLVTVVAALVGGAAWAAPAATVLILVGYVVLLRRWKLQRDEARAMVRELRQAREAAQTRQSEYHGGQRAVGDALWGPPTGDPTPDPRHGPAGVTRWDE